MELMGLWLAIIILILLSAFFSSAETAFTTVNEVKLGIKAEEGSKSAARVLKILTRREAMLSAILIGNNVVNIAASALTTSLVYQLFGNAYLAAATAVLTIVVLIAGEIIPKSIASARALSIACAYSWPVLIIVTVLTPVTALLLLLQKGILRLIRRSDDDIMTEKELMTLIDSGVKEGVIEDDEFEMISNVVDLDKRTARDIMVKRPDITFLSQNVTYKELEAIYRETSYTRYPILDEEGEHVIGTLNMKDLLFAEEEDFRVTRFMREPHFTFEHKNIDDLLDEMRAYSLNMIIVLDEYGMIAGLISLEDILEEIVGEIRDEYDKDEKDQITVLVQSREYLADGATSILDINDVTGLSLSSEDYDSIGGYLIEALDRLPRSGESVSLKDGTVLTAEIVRRNRVEKVHILLPEGSAKS